MKILNACFKKRFESPVFFGLGRQSLLGISCAAVFAWSSLVARAEDRTVLSGHVLPMITKVESAGAPAPATHLRLAIGLPLRNASGLTNLLSDIYNPGSTNYHHYLTPEQFAAQFGPTEADYQAVVAFALSNNFVLTNESHPNRLLLDVDATVADIEKAFKVGMGQFKHPTENRNFYAPTNEPSVPAGLSVVDISGLNNYSLPHPKYHVQSVASNAVPKSGAGPVGTYMGKDFRAAYVPGVTLNGAGQTVGLLQFDGYFPSDILAYENQNGLPNVTLTNVLLDGYNGVPTGFGGEVEVSLDLEMVISMAPGVSKIIVYEAGPFGTPNDILNRMATDNLAKQIGCSWGWSGGPQASTEQIFLQMAAQGQTFCNASGDNDAFLPGQVDDPTYPGSPSSSPNILQVGGTTLTTSGPQGAWVSEKVWQVGGGVGSSGGISSFYSIPSWQQGINMSTNQGSATQRNIPDVSMVGDNVYVIADQGIQYSVGGTSCAAPLWAGFTALVNQQATSSGSSTVGFINPTIYGIGTGPGYTLSFHDITVGNNTNSGSPNLFFAVPGYDLCTGWGTPAGSNLINTLAPPTATPVFTVITNIVSGGNGNGMIDPNECNSLFIGLQNSGATNATTIQVELSTSTPGVAIAQPLASYPNMAAGVSATNLNPFELSTSPSFVCGTTIYLILTIKCDQNISTKVITVQTGTVGQPLRFNNTVPVNIVGGTTNGTPSTVFVTNITTALKHVAVSAYVFESLDFDLTLQLVAPDGATVLLAQNQGFNGQNYGIDCTDANRTTFDDDLGVPFLNSQPPFVGTFIPQQPLAAFIGKQGTNINGTWKLVGIDPFTGDVGTIECWSLFLTPADCVDGGGQCPGVDLGLSMTASPDPVQVSSNIVYTMTVTNRGPDTATSVSLIQNFPATATFVSAVASQGIASHSSNFVSCNFGTLQIGDTALVTVTVTPTVPGTVFASASVGSQQPELNQADNSATVASHVLQPSADLSVSVIANPSPVLLDGLLTYTATVVNHGPSTANNVVLTNLLPQNAGFVSATPSQGSVASSANIVIANLGTLKSGSNAMVTMQVRPLVLGQLTDTASVSSSVLDPVSANNTATVTTPVTAAADLVLTMTGASSVVVGSNITYQLNVQNLGPSPATDVNLRATLPAGVTLLATNSPQGSISVSGNVVSCFFSSLDVNASASLTITVGTSNLFGSVPVTIVNNASVTADQADPNTANNTAAISTLVAFPNLNVVPAGYQLVAESYQPTNGMIEPGETISIALHLQNLGNIDTAANLTATLLNSGGVVPVGSQSHNYGTLAANGPAGSQTFTFTASGTNGGSIIASLQLQNNGTNLSIVNFPFTLAASNAFANANDIVIPDHGPAVPYPSTNIVSGVSGLIGKVTVTFTNFNHTFPDDVDILLVGPKGQNVLLMSHAGNNGVLSSNSITFDAGATAGDATAKFLPQSSQILSGSYRPSQYGSVDFRNSFGGTVAISSNNPPPLAPYGTNLNIFNGTSANGPWLLYVFDSSAGDQGIIRGGWSLGITSGNEVNPVVDLTVSGKVNPASVLEGANLTYSFTVTNLGPNMASVVQFTNVLPANVSFVSATNTAHALCTTNGSGAVYCTLTNLAANGSVTITIVVTPTAAGTLASVATVTGADSDPNQSNNSATVTATVIAPLADLALTMTGVSNAVVGNNVLYSISVTNNGPGTALGVVVTDPGMGLLTFVSQNPSVGTSSVVSNNLAWNVGALAPGAGATINLLLTSAQALTITNTATVATTSNDTNAANNTASFVTVFNNPAPVIVASGARMISGPANGSLIPGQSATVSFSLANMGTAHTANLRATLLAGNGVVSPSAPTNYGVLVASGAAVAKTFSFTASGNNGGSVVATLQLADGTTNLGTVNFAFNLPATNSFANNAAILIPDHGAATPYPSVITVSNVAGLVSKATVTLNNFTHAFPNDVEVLLTAPSGQNLVLLAHVGGGSSVSNVVLTFDDAATASVPESSQYVIAPLVSGTFLPTDDGLQLAFPSPAPATPSGARLSTFNGIAANGDWTLYVFDNSAGDSGSIVNGWSLKLATLSPVNQAADLGITLTRSSGVFNPDIPFTFNIGITNKGPADASNVTVTNTFSSGMSFVATSLGAGSATTAGGSTILHVGSLAAGASANFTVSAVTTVGGLYSSTVNVGSDQTDINLQDNTALLGVQVQNAPRLTAKSGKTNGVFGVTLSVSGQTGTYQIVASTNLFLSLSNWTPVLTTNATAFQFTDTNTASYPRRFYRVIYTP